MTKRLAALAIVLLAACATTNYQPYEGKNNLYDGQGGTMVTVDGVDFWANGTPPRKYTILGYVTGEVGSGYGDEALIQSSVAGEVKKHGGDAAILVNNNTLFMGVVQPTPAIALAAHSRKMQYAVIKYMP